MWDVRTCVGCENMCGMWEDVWDVRTCVGCGKMCTHFLFE